jgi:dTDP-4-dehydrorhamnose 3,5-epimerase
VEIMPLAIEGAWSFTPRIHGDPRGSFLEWFTDASLGEATGHSLAVAQANCSVSSAGVVRGVHFAQVPPGQAKYVTCVNGAALDICVDLRVGSPTFGRWESVLLDDEQRRAVYLSEGLGHAFLALDERTVVVYLCSEPYAPAREFGVCPTDPELGIEWPTQDRSGRSLELLLSEKDRQAPTVAEARASGLLPTVERCRSYRERLGWPATDS